MKYIDEIKAIIDNSGAKDISFMNDDEMFIFKIDIQDDARTIMLFVNESNQMVVVNLIFTFKQGYEKPGLDFYEIIEKLNNNLIIGNLHFLEENSIKYISYKSTYVGDANNFSGNNSFENFLSVSYDMIGMNIDSLARD